MAQCPKCGRKLHIYDWRQTCPGCGINLVYYNSNEQLLRESEQAEIAHAKFQPGVDRAKSATVGSKLGIIRIVISALPLAAVFIPLVKLYAADGSSRLINALSLYKDYINVVGFGPMFGNAFSGDLIALSVVLLLVALVAMLIIGLLLTMSLGKHGKIRNFILDMLLVLLSTGSAVSFLLGSKDLSAVSENYVSGHLYIGAFVVVGLYVTLLVYNLVVAKIGIPVKHQVCLIGGLPSDEYFAMVDAGVSELEIRKKMVAALEKMHAEVRKQDEEARAKEEAERAQWK